MAKLKSLLPLLLLFFQLSCQTQKGIITAQDDQIEIVFLQMNDVYEIAPLEGGKAGGLARVATLKKRLQSDNPNTFAIVAGDFLSPSLIGTMKHEGSRIKGKHMVDVMNAMGVDLVTFGNHEFDIEEKELLQRLVESQFKWVSGNIWHKTGDSLQPFVSGPSHTPIHQSLVLTVKDKDGTSVKMGLLGLTLPSNKASYVAYEDYYRQAANTYDSLQALTDFVVAITHLNLEDDIKLSKKVPGIPLLMGGHDHTNSYDRVGNAVIAKADANARTVYIHKLIYDKSSKNLSIQSSLVHVNSAIPFDPATARVVEKWNTIANQSFKELGFNPTEVVAVTQEPLEGRESVIRHQQTNLGSIITRALSAASPQSALALVNSGSVRLDDQLSGQITEYDIIRTLPYGGKILEVDMKGDLLEKVLEVGRTNAGNGGYLQLDRATYDKAKGKWVIGGKLVSPDQIYRVALTDYLMTGLESNLGFLKPGNPGIINVYEPDPSNATDLRADIRQAVIAYLKSGKN